jgi:DNA-binding GntR family transcriptional regulator
MRSIERANPLYDQIYEILWEKILAGEIAPGERLSDVDWARRLDVSRTPAREAMRKLEQEGMLLPLPRGGYELRAVDPRDLRGLYRCRAALEGLAAREAAEKLSEADCLSLEQVIASTERHVSARAFDAALKDNTQFHARIIEAAQNPHLSRLLHSLRRLILFNRISLINAARLDPHADRSYRGHIERTQHDHRLILQALHRGDGEAASTLMQSHLFATAEDMDAILRQLRAGLEPANSLPTARSHIIETAPADR